MSPEVAPIAGGGTSLRWPDTFLIGLSKAGTSALHDCLTSDVFAGACCAGAKELRLFRFPASREPNATEVLRQQSQMLSGRRRKGPQRRPWPLVQPRHEQRGIQQPELDAPRHVLDFTPGYVTDARVASEMRRFYGDEAATKLHFVVVLRDPAARTRSHFCMAAKNLKHLRDIFLSPEVCRRYPGVCSTPHRRRRRATCEGMTKPALSRGSTTNRDRRLRQKWEWRSRCVDDSGHQTVCTRRVRLDAAGGVEKNTSLCVRKLEWQHAELHRARDRLVRAFPKAIGELEQLSLVGLASYFVREARDREVLRGRYALAEERLHQLYRVVWPWVAASCPPSSSTFGWEFRNLSVVEAVREQIEVRWLGTAGCSGQPRDALTMSVQELVDFCRRCRKHAEGFLHYSDATVPLFTLALFLRLFPSAKWTFVRYEDVFDPRRPRRATVRWLAKLFDVDATPSPAVSHGACNFTGSPAMRPLRFVGNFVSRNRAEEDAQLRSLFAPWQNALEALIAATGHAIAMPPTHAADGSDARAN